MTTNAEAKIEAAKENQPSWALKRADGSVDAATVLCDEHSGGAERVAAIRNAHSGTNLVDWIRVPKAKHECIICVFDATGQVPYDDDSTVNPETGEVVENPWDDTGGAEQNGFWMLSDDDTLEVRAWLLEFLKSRGKELPGGPDKQGGELSRLAWKVGLKIEDAVNGISEHKPLSSYGNANHPYQGYQGSNFGGPTGGYGGDPWNRKPRIQDARDTAFKEFVGFGDVPDEIAVGDDETEDIEVILRDHEAGEHDTPDPACPKCQAEDE